MGAHPLCDERDLKEMVDDEERRLDRLILAEPVSGRAALRRWREMGRRREVLAGLRAELAYLRSPGWDFEDRPA